MSGQARSRDGDGHDACEAKSWRREAARSFCSPCAHLREAAACARHTQAHSRTRLSAQRRTGRAVGHFRPAVEAVVDGRDGGRALDVHVRRLRRVVDQIGARARARCAKRERLIWPAKMAASSAHCWRHTDGALVAVNVIRRGARDCPGRARVIAATRRQRATHSGYRRCRRCADAGRVAARSGPPQPSEHSGPPKSHGTAYVSSSALTTPAARPKRKPGAMFRKVSRSYSGQDCSSAAG